MNHEKKNASLFTSSYMTLCEEQHIKMDLWTVALFRRANSYMEGNSYMKGNSPRGPSLTVCEEQIFTSSHNMMSRAAHYAKRSTVSPVPKIYTCYTLSEQI